MITDPNGNKLPQPTIHKVNSAKNARHIRTVRIAELSNTDANSEKINKNICGVCGYRDRGRLHIEGDHHNNRVAPCRRGR